MNLVVTSGAPPKVEPTFKLENSTPIQSNDLWIQGSMSEKIALAIPERAMSLQLLTDLMRQQVWIWNRDRTPDIAEKLEVKSGYNRDFYYGNLGVLLSKDVPPLVRAELSAMGCHLPGNGAGIVINAPEKFIAYWERYPQVPTRPPGHIFNIPRSETGHLEPDMLCEERLHAAIPDHIGHGVRLHGASDELARHLMKDEGDSDRAAARRVWKHMTDFWKEPTAENLRTTWYDMHTRGGWLMGFLEIEQEQRGMEQIRLVNWVALAAEVGLLNHLSLGQILTHHEQRRAGIEIPKSATDSLATANWHREIIQAVRANVQF